MQESTVPAKKGFQQVKIRTAGGHFYVVDIPTSFKKTASYWEYVVRNRIRWSDDEQARGSLTERSAHALAEIGITEEDLAQIARAEAVEVEIPYEKESQGWELRIFPWEFLLTAATAKERKNAPLVVVRHLLRANSADTTPQVPKTSLVVTSAPGKIGETYSFSSELRLVDANLGLARLSCPANPTLAQLDRTVAKQQPDVIHLAGADSFQGGRLLRERSSTWDGYFLSDEDGTPLVVTAENLAPAVNSAKKHPPALVACNFYYSAARLAAMIVAEGAHAAIGFQDEIEDSVAETFFANFYFAWRTLNWDLLAAFSVAIRETNLYGAGVVLWSDHPLVLETSTKSVQSNLVEVHEKRRQAPPKKDVTRMDVRDVLEVVIKPKPTVNYSLLQNNENIFEDFKIKKLWQGPLRDITVKTTLWVGSDSFPFQMMFDVVAPIVSLEESVRIPLTSVFVRSLKESVQTVLSVTIWWNQRRCYLNTFRIALLAIDEWVDTPELDAYLPTFVLSRDRAVTGLISAAQRYLMCLNDDGSAGFDGYQSVDKALQNPTEGVDLQAQAIWCALTYESPLSYINPPPTFTEASQRLRSPSDVVTGGRGTCIDLALLLAACYEYIGLYPVIFLLTGHAFPGYWRSDEARQRFIEVRRQPVPNYESQRDARNQPRPPKPWVFNDHSEVVQLVQSGDLIPLETVWLTQHKGFWEAVDAGMDNLRSRSEFACMIDVQGARINNVTPLPVIGVSE